MSTVENLNEIRTQVRIARSYLDAIEKFLNTPKDYTLQETINVSDSAILIPTIVNDLDNIYHLLKN